MSEEPTEESLPPVKRRRGALLAAAALALVGGAATGVFALGPMLRGEGAAAEAGADAGHGESAGGHGGGDHGSSNDQIFSVENLVVNPASSQGTRFLIVTVALEMKTAEGVAELTGREHEVRDLLLGLLSARTVEQLSDPNGRDSLKDDIRSTTEKVVGAGEVLRVFIPQYVLQ